MAIIVLAVVLGPSCVVFLAGCVLAIARTYEAHRHVSRMRQRGRAF